MCCKQTEIMYSSKFTHGLGVGSGVGPGVGLGVGLAVGSAVGSGVCLGVLRVVKMEQVLDTTHMGQIV